MQAIKLPVMVIFQDVTPILSLLYSRSKDRTINLQRVKINASLLRFILGLVSLKLEKNPYNSIPTIIEEIDDNETKMEEETTRELKAFKRKLK